MKTIEKAKLANLVAIYFSYFSKIQNRENDNGLYNSIKNWFNYNHSDVYIQYCLKKYQYLKMSFVELDILYLSKKDDFDRFKYPVERVQMFCESCHTSTTETQHSEIIEQTYKYGIFICKRCESNSINHIPSNKYMISYHGIYEDEGCSNPKEKMLGFGGRWFLIRKNDKMWLTNNLFLIQNFHEKLQRYYAHKINAAVISIENTKHLESILSDDELNEVKKYNNGYNWNHFIK